MSVNDDPVYDDGSEIEVVTEQDEGPTSGVWMDSEELIHNPTDEELAAGERQGHTIDQDDDRDNGMWGPGRIRRRK